MKTIIVIGILTTTLFMGCASTYSKKGGLGAGYDETKLSDTSYSVSFLANGFTTMEETKKYLYRRSAELTLESKFQYFTSQQSEDGFMNGTMPFKSHVIVMYHEGEQPKGAFNAETVMANTIPKK